MPVNCLPAIRAGERIMSTKTFTRCAWLLIVAGLSACGSDNDISAPEPAEVTPVEDTPAVVTESVSDEESANGNSDETDGEAGEVVNDPVDSDASETDDCVEPNEDSSQQNNQGQPDTDSQQQPSIPETDGGETQNAAADSQNLSFGAAKLLVDLDPNGSSNPAKFRVSGDNLYFLTVDADPRFANCAWHWGNLSDDDKSISFSLVSVDPDTGVVAMNSPFMTLGDFADDPNYACAGYNGSIMQVFQQTWLAGSAAGEEQFAVHFEETILGPDHVWATDGNQVSRLETGGLEEHTFFEGDKVFVANDDGFWVSDSLAGDRRKLFETDSEQFYYDNIKRIARSHQRLATFEIRVGENRTQIWTYDLDTDEWAKTFSIKPDNNVYTHYETLLVDGPVIVSLGRSVVDRRSVLGISSALGDVTSFEVLSGVNTASVNSDLNDPSRSAGVSHLIFSGADLSVDPPTSSIWRYSDERIEKLFSIPADMIDMMDRVIIEGHDGRIYVAGTWWVSGLPGFATSLELWSYDPRTEQLIELSDDNWFSVLSDHQAYDEGFMFRYLNTPDGLAFINLTEDSGRELWFTNGTREGTRQLTDINPGIGSSDPLDYYYTDDAIYFSANDGTRGREPWMIPISR